MRCVVILEGYGVMQGSCRQQEDMFSCLILSHHMLVCVLCAVYVQGLLALAEPFR
jgi:hypothetical protein